MDLDPVLLSRIQFAFVISFHILFPAFTIGLANFIALLEVLWLATRRQSYLRLSVFWTRIFAVSFGMGVVSGIVMSYQFGTNWSRFSDVGAGVLGPLLTYEVLTAFFLEASFLGVLLFGRQRVPPPMMAFAAVMVAAGTLASAFWILAAGSWMHTPAGFAIENGLVVSTDWMAVIFNPSFPYRLAHMTTAAFLTTAFAVLGVGAWYVLRGRESGEVRTMVSMTLWLVLVLAPLQVVLGDLHGLNTLEYQPAKVAAMEGHWEPQRGAPAILFALPDVGAETNRYEIGIPRLGSLILTHDLDGLVPGLKQWAPQDRPYVPLVFWSFRVMVAIGFLMVLVAVLGNALRPGGRLWRSRFFLRLCVLALPGGFVAVLAGWIVTEAGRQPWLVYNVMRTADGVSPVLTGGAVLASLTVYVLVYAVIFGAGTTYIVRLVRRGPEAVDLGRPDPEGTAARPLSGAGPARPQT